MKRYIPTIITAFLLAGCGSDHVNSASAEPIVVQVPVAVAVDAPCVPDTLKEAPTYVDSDKALTGAADAAERYQLLWAGRGQKNSRLNELEPIVAGCPRGKSKP